MAYVWQPKSEEWKPVTNLGWLLKNWWNVEKFEVSPIRHDGYIIERPLLKARKFPEKTEYEGHHSCWLIAHSKDGRDYVTTWADYTLLKDWLVRPKFMGLPVRWFGVSLIIPDRKKDW